MSSETTKRTKTLAERGLVRLSVDIPADDADRLAETAASTGYNKVTTLMRAIRLLFDLERAVQNGGHVTLTHRDGTRERLLLR